MSPAHRRAGRSGGSLLGDSAFGRVRICVVAYPVVFLQCFVNGLVGSRLVKVLVVLLNASLCKHACDLIRS